ncbi:MAG: RNA polymerase sigma factor [Planctomycetota bacterium]
MGKDADWNERERETATTLGAPAASAFTDTETALAAARQGDEAGFERLWQRFVPGLEVTLAGKLSTLPEPRLRSRMLANLPDLLQEVLLKASTNLESFEYRGPGSLLAWLQEIARNELRNRLEFWRAERRDVRREQEAAFSNETFPRAPAPPAPGPGPRTAAGVGEQRLRVGAALEALDHANRRLLFFRYFARASWQEIAESLGFPTADAARMECTRNALPALALALDSPRSRPPEHRPEPPPPA